MGLCFCPLWFCDSLWYIVICYCIFTYCSSAWDALTGKLQWVQEGHEDAILCMALSNDGSLLLTGADDATVRVFSTAGPKQSPSSTEPSAPAQVTSTASTSTSTTSTSSTSTSETSVSSSG